MAGNLFPAVAIVTGTDGAGRARVKFPWLDSNTVANARVCKHVGPLTSDTEVLVVFMFGDPNYPIVVGRF